MKALSVSLIAALAVLCLSGCASTRAGTESARAAPSLSPEQSYVAEVERAAVRRNLDVIWVNPPEAGRSRLVADQ